MAIVRSASVESGLRRLDPKIRVILFYGFDEARIRSLAAMAVRRVAGSLDDPFNVQRLEESELAKSPGRLLDEVQSLSMMGGRRVVWAGDADVHFQKAIEPVLKAEQVGNLVIAEAGNLGKSSPLRALLEKSDSAWIVPVYEPSIDEARDFLAAAFAAAGLMADQSVLQLLIQSYGTDFGLLGQEAKKLAVYCLGHDAITVEDVEAICASGGELNFDDVVDAALRGEVERVETLLVRMTDAGEDAGQVAGACYRHVVRLEEMHLAIERGQSLDQAVRGAKPLIFFKRVPAVTAQLKTWNLAELMNAAATLVAGDTAKPWQSGFGQSDRHALHAVDSPAWPLIE